MMENFISTCLLFVIANVSFAQQNNPSDKEKSIEGMWEQIKELKEAVKMLKN